MSSTLKLSMHLEEWHARIPFRIAGYVWNSFRVVVVEVADGSHKGWGEGLPVWYLNETVDTMCQQIATAAPQIERGIDRLALLQLMPPGGARNAVDCALWDLEAKRSNHTIWQLTGIEPKPVTTAFTIGIEERPEDMAARASEALEYPILKIKLDRREPVQRVSAIRAARPDAKLTVDANQAWTFEEFKEITPRLAELNVSLIEQPLARGADEQLEGYSSPIPLCGDESCQHRGELAQASRRYDVINIKLDKAGGLTEALLLAEAARAHELEVLVSNMGGTSLSMAPAFVLAQVSDYIELDGPLLLSYDRIRGSICRYSSVSIPEPTLWG